MYENVIFKTTRNSYKKSLIIIVEIKKDPIF
jgi:hypothetical protein